MNLPDSRFVEMALNYKKVIEGLQADLTASIEGQRVAVDELIKVRAENERLQAEVARLEGIMLGEFDCCEEEAKEEANPPVKLFDLKDYRRRK